MLQTNRVLFKFKKQQREERDGSGGAGIENSPGEGAVGSSRREAFYFRERTGETYLRLHLFGSLHEKKSRPGP